MDNYTIYKFTFSDGKVYIGQTNLPVEERWKNGEGYKGQDVYIPIILEDWNNIKKEILHTSLTQEQANELEKHYIKKFNSIKNGYNRTIRGTANPAKHIKIDIQDDYFLTFIKENVAELKPSALKILLYFICNNHYKIQFILSRVSKEVNLSDKTCNAALDFLIKMNIVRPTSIPNEYEVIIKDPNT